MAEEYTETSTEGWGSRLRGSWQSVGVGAVLVLISIGALIFNEANLVAERKALKESEAALIEVTNIASIDPKNEGKLVHLTGFATTGKAFTNDTVFGVSLNETLKLKRSVEMYQWQETVKTSQQKKTGGSVTTTKTYKYSKTWSSYLIDSDNFKEDDTHKNPEVFPFGNEVTEANDVTLGAFALSEDVLDQLYAYKPLPTPLTVESIPAATKIDALTNKTLTISKYQNNGFYIGKNSATPAVGDVRVVFERVPTQTLSIVGQQSGGELTHYETSNERDVLLVEPGTVSADDMFLNANKTARQVAWAIRVLSFVFLWIAFDLMAEPLSTFADVLPLLGTCVDGIVTVMSGLVAVVVWMVTVALAWLFFRPVFSLILFAIVGVVVFGIVQLRQANKRRGKGYEEISLAEDPEATKPSYTDAQTE